MGVLKLLFYVLVFLRVALVDGEIKFGGGNSKDN